MKINDIAIEKYLNNMLDTIKFDAEKDILMIGVDINAGKDIDKMYDIRRICGMLKDHEVEFIAYPNNIIDNIDTISDKNKQKYIELFENIIEKLKS